MDPYKITFKTWNKLAAVYQEMFMDLDLYNDSYDHFCERIVKVQARVLEIGCGPGNITRYLVSKRPDFNVTAIDVAPSMIERAQQNNPSVHYEVMDARDLHILSHNYDGIICGFCIPYMDKTAIAKLIKDSSHLLQTGGICYGSFIEGAYDQSGYESGSTGDQTYVYYYEKIYFNTLLKKHHFKEIHWIPKNYSKKDGSQQTHLIFIATKNNDI